MFSTFIRKTHSVSKHVDYKCLKKIIETTPLKINITFNPVLEMFAVAYLGMSIGKNMFK